MSTAGKDQEMPQQIADRLEKVAGGQATIAQAVGLSREQLYKIADKAYQLFSQGRLDEAKQIYQGLVAADPYDSVFHCHFGAVLWRAGELDRAFEEYDAAVRYNFANVDALAGRGELLISRGDVEKGIEDLSAALKYDQDCERPSTQRARALLLSMREAANARLQN
jgi:tetratricopeptide (TPR) repeat protein